MSVLTKYPFPTGVEKNNDDARRFYFSSNFKDAIGEILKAEARVHTTSLYKRKKRSYTRKNPTSASRTSSTKRPRLDTDLTAI